MMEKKIPNYLKLTIMFVLGCLSYFTLLVPETLVNPDAQFILPTITSSQGVLGYLQKLFSLQTLDLQPVRDLSFFFDIVIYEKTGINVFVFQNILVWVISCWFFYKTIKNIFTDLSDNELFTISLLLLTYPLIAPTVSWGVARKHLLSLMFGLIATENWTRKRDELSHKDAILMSLYYALAILSQPIALLFPFWCFSYTWLLNRNSLKSSFKFFVPSFILFAFIGWANYYYYENSFVFRSTFDSKLNEALNISDQILALGHYSFQLFYPYLLSFKYSLGHWATLAGLALLGLFMYLILGLKIPKKEALVWALYGLLPLSIIIIKPTMLSDNYLLFPVVGFFILLLYIRSKLNWKSKHLAVYMIIICLWGCFDFFESRLWRDEVSLTEKGFERRESCFSASQFLKMSYENEQPQRAIEAKNYLLNNECGDFKSQHKDMFLMSSYVLYYDDSIAVEKRLETLEKIAPSLFLHHMIWASLLVKEKRFKEADEAINQMYSRWGSSRFKNEYVPIAAKVLYPYCKETTNQRCIDMLSPLTKKKKDLFYK